MHTQMVLLKTDMARAQLHRQLMSSLNTSNLKKCVSLSTSIRRVRAPSKITPYAV